MSKRVVVVSEAERMVDANTLSVMTGLAPYTLRQKFHARQIPGRKFGRCLRFNPQAVIEALQRIR